MSEKILTKNYIEKLGYEVEELDYRIFLVKNFLLEDEIELLLNKAKNASEEEWTIHYMDGVRRLAKLKFGRDDIDNLVKEGLYEITDNWIDKNLSIDNIILTKKIDNRTQELFNFSDNLAFMGCGTIQRQYEGVPLKDHVDNHTDPSLEYAVVFYLNEDYSKGEVYFVNQNIKLKPTSGSILIFPTSENWRHGVEAPGDGPHRYIIPGFVTRKNFWKIHEQNKYNIDKTLADTKK